MWIQPHDESEVIVVLFCFNFFFFFKYQNMYQLFVFLFCFFILFLSFIQEIPIDIKNLFYQGALAKRQEKLKIRKKKKFFEE